MKAAVKLLKALPSFALADSVCCMEHTARRTVGIYNAHALAALHKMGVLLWLERSLQIKQSGGMQRGKSDAVDAARIADRAPGGVRLPLPRPPAIVAATPGFRCVSEQPAPIVG